MKNNRTLNGYVVVYRPGHPRAMTSENWNGYVYEHIVVAEEDFGRALLPDEEVHHLDLNRSNNRPSNLIILSKKSHGRLHKWIDGGAIISKQIDSKNANNHGELLRCMACNKPLKLKQRHYCSTACLSLNRYSKMEGVNLSDVLQKLSNNSFVKVSSEYGISDNGLRKWLNVKHGLNKQRLNEIIIETRKNV